MAFPGQQVAPKWPLEGRRSFCASSSLNASDPIARPGTILYFRFGGESAGAGSIGRALPVAGIILVGASPWCCGSSDRTAPAPGGPTACGEATMRVTPRRTGVGAGIPGQVPQARAGHSAARAVDEGGQDGR